MMSKERYTSGQIRQLRVAKGMTPTQFAVHLGVCENTVRRWEIGDRHPYPKTQQLLYHIYKRLCIEGFSWL